ncbi:MAG: TonB-dependent receptor plug domain-containing protein [Verrucomicrobia bacterium]|nr:TonB-dependent receptor plug domain-containing protein [Verrucomicrobiota bacterium]
MKTSSPQPATAVGKVQRSRHPSAAAAMLAFAVAAVSLAAQQPSPASTTGSRTGEAAKEEAIKLSVFEVSEQTYEGYRSTQTLSGTNTLSSLRDTPNSISVANRELIDDLMATTVHELSMYTITGEVGTGTEATGTEIGGGGFIMRGIAASPQLVNGVRWWVPVDTFNVDRVEILRGPTAFLYGGGAAGGTINQVSKQAVLARDFQKANVMIGNNNLYRAEFDLNRRINDKLAIRAAMLYTERGALQKYFGGTRRGINVGINFRPFTHTIINANVDYGRINDTLGMGMLVDTYALSERLGTTTAHTTTNGGPTYLPSLDLMYNTVGLRRSTGTAMAITDSSFVHKELNFSGPDAYNNVQYNSIGAQLNQRVFENFNIQLAGTLLNARRQVYSRGVAAQNGGGNLLLLKDVNPTLPGGAPNPYFGEYYTEFNHRLFVHREPVVNARLLAVYDVKLPFTTQRIVASARFESSGPDGINFGEFIMPGTPEFRGTLTNANTAAAYVANTAVMRSNMVYRRYYLRDGDDPRITRAGPAPGKTVMMTNFVVDGNLGRNYNRYYMTPGFGVGASGTYFKERLHTLVGWRRDSFIQEPQRQFYNYATGERYQVPEPKVRIDNSDDSYNYGGVFHVTSFASLYFNYAETMTLSSAANSPSIRRGVLIGPAAGEGFEYGLRWMFFKGRIETNWTYYVSSPTNLTGSIPTAVRLMELAPHFNDFDPDGVDTQARDAKGLEFETTTNLTPGWRLTWNFATNKIVTSQRYPALKAYQAEAKAKGIPTPETDAFLATVPEGTPIAGYTKIRSNLVTNYRFDRGPLNNLSIGGGVQYRDKAYRGNYDLDRNGVAEEHYSAGYFLVNLTMGYRSKVWDRKIDWALNVTNLFGKEYYRSYALGAGQWDTGRTIRLAARIDL